MARRSPARAPTYPAARFTFEGRCGRRMTIEVADDGPLALDRARNLASQDGRLTLPVILIRDTEPTNV